MSTHMSPTCVTVDTIPESASSLFCCTESELSAAAANASALHNHILFKILCAHGYMKVMIPFSFFSNLPNSFCSLASILCFCFSLQNEGNTVLLGLKQYVDL